MRRRLHRAEKRARSSVARLVTRRARRPLMMLGALFALSLSGCGDADFSAKSAADFAPTSAVTASVLGVFRDGMMTSDAWDAMGPVLSPALHGTKCDVAYGEAHVKQVPALSSALEEYTRDNGVTDELFAALAPASTGDLVVVFTVAGRVQKPSANAANTGVRALTGRPSPSPIRGGMNSPARNNGTRPDRKPVGGLEVSASFYSKKTGHGVALVSMRYTGESEEEGLREFAKKLAAFMPNVTCAPWKNAAEGMPEPDQIRALVKPEP